MIRMGVLLAAGGLVLALVGCGGDTSSLGPSDIALEETFEPLPGDIAPGAPSLDGPFTITTFRPPEDTYINQGAPATNYGADSRLRTGNYPAGNAKRSLMRFNLTQIPTTATVNNARLRLYVIQAYQGTDRVRVHRVTSAWTELGTTWATAPMFAAGAVDTESISPTMVGTWIEWTVTGLVQSWVDTPGRNFGCLLRGIEGTAMVGDAFASGENPTTAHRPRLVVTYAP